MFAIFKTGGKQLKASIGDILYIEKIDAEENDLYTFSEVLMIDGNIGNPLLKGAGVKVKIIKQGRGKKLKVVRYHPKKNVNKIYGHRQPFTKVEVVEILENGVTGDGITKSSSKLVGTKEPKKDAAIVKPKPAVKPEKIDNPIVEPQQTEPFEPTTTEVVETKNAPNTTTKESNEE